MEPDSPISLSDLFPALRWSRPREVDDALSDPRLPEGWWKSVSLPRAVTTLGLDEVCDRLARFAMAHWDHLPLHDLLPSLLVTEVDLAIRDWPAAVRATVMGNTAGWDGLRRVTPAAITEWLRPRPADPAAVVATTFHEVLARLVAKAETAPATRETPAPPMDSGAVPPMPTPDAVPSMPAPDAVPSIPAPDAVPPMPTPDAVPPMPVPDAVPPMPVPDSVPGMPDPDAMPPAAEAPVPPPAAFADVQAPQPAPVFAGGTAGVITGEDVEHEAQAVPGPDLEAAPQGSPDLIDLVNAVFARADRLEQAIAVERLFADEPVSLRALAHQIGADVQDMRGAQRSAEERILGWLRSQEAEPLTRYMMDLGDWLGAAATQDALMGADPILTTQVPTLRAPFWRILLVLMPDRRFQDGWLIAGDMRTLREQTWQVMSDPGDKCPEEALALLGIKAHSAQGWLASMPPRAEGQNLSASSSLPVRTPGASWGSRRESGEDADDPPTVESSPRCFRAPDGSWWHRIDVTTGHLLGDPVSIPAGYAAYLGLRPGNILAVNGPGDDAIVLLWRDRPVFDNLQPLLQRIGAAAGDHVFVAIKEFRLDARHLPGTGANGHSSIDLALRLIGYTSPASSGEAVKIIARRIGANADDVDMQSLLSRLHARGDSDILTHLSGV